jgi:hypothetical protein
LLAHFGRIERMRDAPSTVSALIQFAQYLAKRLFVFLQVITVILTLPAPVRSVQSATCLTSLMSAHVKNRPAIDKMVPCFALNIDLGRIGLSGNARKGSAEMAHY